MSAPVVVAVAPDSPAQRAGVVPGDRILAINPNVHAGIADPDGMEFYHNIHKSEYDIRPRGHFTYAEMRADIERIRRTAENIRVDLKRTLKGSLIG